MTIDQRAFRDALGKFPTGVTIVTAAPEGHSPFGVTANSFASVSLDPPLVLWSLQKSSDTFAAFEKASHFAINVLSAGQEALSNQYARKNQHDLADDHYTNGHHGSPRVNGALVTFECEKDAWHDGGDHIIMVGKVLAMSDVSGEAPLVFHSGAYNTLSQA